MNSPKKKSEREISSTIASKNNTKEIKDPCNESFKLLKKEILLPPLEDGKSSHACELAELILERWPHD